jgi:hypothetical protein
MKAAVLHGIQDIRIEHYREPVMHPGFEASGAAPALRSAFDLVRPGGKKTTQSRATGRERVVGARDLLDSIPTRNRYPVSAEDFPMNEFERVILVLNVRSFGRSMDYDLHQVGCQRELFYALR